MGYSYDQGLGQGAEQAGVDNPSSSSSIQLFSCLYGVRELPGGLNVEADRRVSFLTVDDPNQNLLEVNNQLGAVYPNSLEVPNSLTDAELLSVYQYSTPGTPTQPPPTAMRADKRNCHIIKCPKFSESVYGSDGGTCYEFSNQCFMAVASCKRHNNRLPRLKEVTKKHCEKHLNRVVI
ncbi:hypothetical protein AWZ03_001548 [Drosophila navojoa]|uniref:Kazal-like domain-containing protein n=2 Tax=Drosophila navojoa TaxID=7232 RepID=A0A484BSX0_DRONA|nr:hypothetical protein AWZ03_001548 [Drosophila navojoa]